jgi:hypothetical protein
MIITASPKALRLLQEMINLKGHVHLKLSRLHTLETITIVQTVLSTGVAHVTMDLDERENNRQYELEKPAFDLLVTRQSTGTITSIVILQGTYIDIYGRPAIITEASLASEFDSFLEYISELFFIINDTEQQAPYSEDEYAGTELYDSFDLTPDDYDNIPDFSLMNVNSNE